MKHVILASLALSAFAGAGLAGNSSEVSQTGRNVAVTFQSGDDNSAVTTQFGKRNISSIVQVGSGHDTQTVQTGTNNISAKTQVTTRGFTGTHHVTKQNAHMSVEFLLEFKAQ